MLQRYDISIDNDTNRLSIQEFAVIGRKPRKNEYYDFTLETFSLIHEVSYEVDTIRAASQKGAEALISEIRSPAFFPIESCAEAIAESVTGLLNGDPEPASEVFFDDRTLLSTYTEKENTTLRFYKPGILRLGRNAFRFSRISPSSVHHDQE